MKDKIDIANRAFKDIDSLEDYVLKEKYLNYDSSAVIDYIEKAVAITQEANKVDEKDIRILNFIYNRMVNVHKENKNYDYMLNFKAIVDYINKKGV